MRRSIIALIVALALTGTAHAQSTQEKGYQIAKTAVERGQGFGSSESVGEMTLRDGQGVISSRRFRTLAREVGDGGDQYIIVFELPKDIAGTAVLTHSNPNRADDQWLYLPELKRVKRITSGGRTSAFAGSEFTYEDLGSSVVDQYAYNWLRDEPCPGQSSLTCFVIERRPKTGSSGYARHVVWLDQSQYRVHKIDFFDRSNTHVKTLTAGSFRQYEGRYWLADRVVMTNLRTGKSTEMKWTSRDFSVNLTANDFLPNSLAR